jgi:glycosyltransferase involved in cell wall biosynthesis
MYPKISIVTACFNAERFVEASIQSVLEQGYPNLEYIVIDGGSTDDTVRILERYSPHFSYWVSEPDQGQSDALNRGFSRSTGDIIAWQNADDLYLPNAFWEVAEVFRSVPDADLVFSNILLIDSSGSTITDVRFTPFSLDHLLYAGWNTSSQSAFWSRTVMERTGRLKVWPHTWDWDWFLRVGRQARRVVHKRRFWGAYRLHQDALSARVPTRERWQYVLAVLRDHDLTVSEDASWAQLFKLKRFQLLGRQLFWYGIQGDLGYVVRRAVRRRHIVVSR